jgi:LemA protein
MVLIILIALLVLVGLFFLFTYNSLIRKRNNVDNSWAQIEAALQRRHDLIPNLVESVKGYAKHEQSTFEAVTKARSTAMAAKAPGTQAKAEDALTSALGRINAVAEQYPELKATENFQQLSSNLSDTENQIQITRRVYNDTVQTYNTAIQVFPPSIVANAANFEPRQFFDAPEGSEATPEVSFSGGDAPAAGGEAPAKK